MTTGAKKNNKLDKKPAYKFLAKQFLDNAAYPMMAGEVKYGSWNYMKGHLATDLVEAAIRHLMLVMAGEWLDKDCSETLGIDVTHLGCAAANINMLFAQLEAGTLKNDLVTLKERSVGIENKTSPLSFDALDKILADIAKLKEEEEKEEKNDEGDHYIPNVGTYIY